MSLALFGLVFGVVFFGLKNTSGSVEDQGLRTAEKAIICAMVSCYAIEGSYPESYEYLKENYGLAVNEERYIVKFNNFASNIMPEVTVIPRGGVK